MYTYKNGQKHTDGTKKYCLLLLANSADMHQLPEDSVSRNHFFITYNYITNLKESKTTSLVTEYIWLYETQASINHTILTAMPL